MVRTTTPPISGGRHMPASPTALKPLILECLRQGPLRRRVIIGKLKELASASGFSFNETPQGIAALKKALRGVLVERLIFQPQARYWQIKDLEVQADPAGGDEPDDHGVDEDSEDEDLTEETNNVSIAPGLTIERTIGDGPESVYVYRSEERCVGKEC